jgi:hypothetical protein
LHSGLQDRSVANDVVVALRVITWADFYSQSGEDLASISELDYTWPSCLVESPGRRRGAGHHHCSMS